MHLHLITNVTLHNALHVIEYCSCACGREGTTTELCDKLIQYKNAFTVIWLTNSRHRELPNQSVGETGRDWDLSNQ